MPQRVSYAGTHTHTQIQQNTEELSSSLFIAFSYSHGLFFPSNQIEKRR